jgi:hypothetical protein
MTRAYYRSPRHGVHAFLFHVGTWEPRQYRPPLMTHEPRMPHSTGTLCNALRDAHYNPFKRLYSTITPKIQPHVNTPLKRLNPPSTPLFDSERG